MVYDCVVIGGGPGGMSAALWCTRLTMSVALLEADAVCGGQILWANHPLESYLGLPAHNGRELAATMERHVRSTPCAYFPNTKANKIDLQRFAVEAQKQTFSARTIVLAMGVRPRSLGVPGEEPHVTGQWSTGLPTDARADEKIVVVGGGDSAADAALTAARRGAQVTLLVRGEKLRAQLDRQNELRQLGVKIERNSRIESFGANEVRYNGQTVWADRILIRAGWVPNSELVAKSLDLTDGYVVTDRRGITSNPRVAAVGDICNPPDDSSMISAAGQGMRAVKQLYKTLGRES